MELFIVIAIWIGLLYAIYKFAESKNREPAGYILGGIVLSPILILIILVFLKQLPGKKKKLKKR
tara:strand:+ start:129 stop:320 length:192 start_codon:yes stop_codon:yes gene_type:complete